MEGKIGHNARRSLGPRDMRPGQPVSILGTTVVSCEQLGELCTLAELCPLADRLLPDLCTGWQSAPGGRRELARPTGR